MKLGNYLALQPLCEEALKISEQLGDPAGAIISHRGLAYYHLYQSNFNKAEEQAKLSLEKAIKQKAIQAVSSAYLILSQIALVKKEYPPSQRYQYKSDSIQEIIFAEEKLKNVHRLEVQYEIKQKEQKVNELQKEAEIKDLAIKKNQLLVAVLILFILTGVFVSWLTVRSIRQRKRLLENENQLNLTKIKQLESEQQLAASQSLIKGQEEERGRLAKDLHDGLGGLLSGVKFSLTNMKSNVVLTSENAMAFERSLDMLDHSISELRRVAHNMMPEVLVKFGLSEALKSYCESIRQAKVFQIDYQYIGEEKRMASNTEIIAYRIAQELMNNIMKHARATRVMVQVATQGNELTLTVEDNGIGFDVSATQRLTNSGWTNIRSRVDFLKGKLDIQSSADAGTSVHITLPII
jgi:two-component system, NarL family, sensor kinase